MRISARLAIPLALLVLPLLSWLPLSGPAVQDSLSATVGRRHGQARLEERDGLFVLHLEGTPYEMGYQHGALLRHEIREGLREQIYQRLILEEGVSHFLLLRHARSVDRHLPSEYRQEMYGLADGAGISYSDVLLLNSLHDLISQPAPSEEIRALLLAVHPLFVPPYGLASELSSAVTSDDNASIEGIPSLSVETAFVAFGRATKDGKLLHGFDFSSSQPSPGELLLIIYQPQEENALVSLAWPGAVGVTMGLNEEKMSVVELASPSQDVSLEGVPLPFVLRDVLEYAGDIPTALGLIASAGRTTGKNVLIGDGKPADAQAMELSAHLYAVFEAEDDIIVRANHYLDPTLAETQTQESFPRNEYESSLARLEAMYEELDGGYGRLDLSGAINLLGERRPANDTGEESVLGIVIASSDLEVWILSVAGLEEQVGRWSLKLDEEL